ncbi:hypothetical protein N7508_005411 [Penicillium antarcticum]|uniref:uncharacterized protein n=1 Tax=Penicillium antarcticum TaxID=416450 RepID=UPI002391D029|nr:uncharacterized protein N7508_005411 [Penicillium antarcticum]KAJ5306396.1 hypothetical protein N7508_005411 [Penicillium antarcticum]
MAFLLNMKQKGGAKEQSKLYGWDLSYPEPPAFAEVAEVKESASFLTTSFVFKITQDFPSTSTPSERYPRWVDLKFFAWQFCTALAENYGDRKWTATFEKSRERSLPSQLSVVEVPLPKVVKFEDEVMGEGWAGVGLGPANERQVFFSVAIDVIDAPHLSFYRDLTHIWL